MSERGRIYADALSRIPDDKLQKMIEARAEGCRCSGRENHLVGCKAETALIIVSSRIRTAINLTGSGDKEETSRSFLLNFRTHLRRADRELKKYLETVS